MEHKPTIRVLEILEALAAENQGVSLTHLSEKTGILKGTIFPSSKRWLNSGTSVMTLIPSFIIWDLLLDSVPCFPRQIVLVKNGLQRDEQHCQRVQ